MKRRRAELERDAGDHEHEPEREQRAVLRMHHVADDDVDLRKVERAGRAVDHRHAVEQKTGRHRAKHEVLDGGFGGRA